LIPRNAFSGTVNNEKMPCEWKLLLKITLVSMSSQGENNLDIPECFIYPHITENRLDGLTGRIQRILACGSFGRGGEMKSEGCYCL
jgi:hypothetical protein